MKMEPIGCPETSAVNYHYSLRNKPEERSSILIYSILFYSILYSSLQLFMTLAACRLGRFMPGTPSEKGLLGPTATLRMAPNSTCLSRACRLAPSAFHLSCLDFLLLCYTDYLSARPPNGGPPGNRCYAATFVNCAYTVQISQ